MTNNVEFMRTIEKEYREVSGLKNRSEYKIFYGQVFAAPFLTMGLNPGGSPEETSEDGTLRRDGSLASASASYFEQMENDILDCHWRENAGLRKLLLPLVANDQSRFRSEIVKTNIAFRRSRATSEINFEVAEREAVPFIEKIIARVNPKLILLTGPSIDRFLTLYGLDSRSVAETIRAPGINQVVFAANATRLRLGGREAIVVQVAHASQFSWTYDKYDVPTKIADLIGQPIGQATLRYGVSRSPDSKASTLLSKGLDYQVPAVRRAPAQRFKHPRLAELESRWLELAIGSQFRRVHHFSSPKFSGKGDTLDRFLAWCDVREIKAENDQTVKRALDLASRMEAGRTFEEALRQAWAAYPTVGR
jgi:hypothetical protein